MNPLSANTFEGLANIVGVIDRGGDVVAPGAFGAAIPEFLRTGFIALSHDWDALPVAMPDAAEERPEGLWVRGVFHSTPAAQAARETIRERLDQGLRVGLSIGFRADPADCAGFGSGAELLAHMARQGIPANDPAGIAAWRGPCRLVRRIAELFEVSIVAVPMNSGSHVEGVKAPPAIRSAFEANRRRLAAARALDPIPTQEKP